MRGGFRKLRIENKGGVLASLEGHRMNNANSRMLVLKFLSIQIGSCNSIDPGFKT